MIDKHERAKKRKDERKKLDGNVVWYSKYQKTYVKEKHGEIGKKNNG